MKIKMLCFVRFKLLNISTTSVVTHTVSKKFRMKISNFIIHHIKKDQHGAPTVKLRPKEIELTAKEENLSEFDSDFLNQTEQKFSKQRRGRFYAKIDRKGENLFYSILKDYLEEKKNEFYEFSTELTSTLKHDLENVPLATGGYVAIAEYELEDQKILLIILMRQEVGFAIDPDKLVLRQSVQLDLNNLNIGARIDVSCFLDDDSEEDITIVSGLKDLSHYVRNFFGVSSIITPEVQTNNLAEVINSYADTQKYSDELILEVRQKVASFIKDAKGEPFSLTSIAALVDPQNPQNFEEYANDKKVNTEIHGDHLALKGWFRINYSSKKLKIDFDKTLLNDGVIWDKTAKKLTIEMTKFPDLEKTLLDSDV